MDRRSPSQLYALIFGVVLVAAGIAGFFYEASFATGDDTLVEREAVLGILDVNGWHNLVHILTGVIGLLVVGSYANARVYALAFGGVYILVAILGFIYGDGVSIFKLIPVNTEDNVLHALIGVAGPGAGMATPANRRRRQWLPLSEVERERVDAVTLAGRVRAVVEDVAQVPTAVAADDLGADHAVARVLAQLDGLLDRGLGEARPAGAGVELRVGVEQLAPQPAQR